MIQQNTKNKILKYYSNLRSTTIPFNGLPEHLLYFIFSYIFRRSIFQNRIPLSKFVCVCVCVCVCVWCVFVCVSVLNIHVQNLVLITILG